ncbi:MAG: hypothetical protein GW903_08460 [Alphaproteobacteria bacterium]|nr:hypothetical protein [Alphaproteobacteria bacterium]NCQ88756.1 hypothetical protein [Alphaproteobacteria bacterium]NCT07321.1 hypothetical protein [Alphaproteobacteria bacterium]
MDTRINNTLLASLLASNTSGTTPNQAGNNSANQNANKERRANAAPQDLVALSNAGAPANIQIPRTRLIAETTDQLENGYRRTQQFENSERRQFTRIEEFTSQGNRATRSVVEQNASGSTTLLEDVFDRRGDGSFRLTQRFTNEIGETVVNIDPNANPRNADIVLGRAPRTDSPPANISLRGTELNLLT